VRRGDRKASLPFGFQEIDFEFGANPEAAFACIEAALEVEVERDSEALDRAFKKVVPTKRPPSDKAT